MIKEKVINKTKLKLISLKEKDKKYWKIYIEGSNNEYFCIEIHEKDINRSISIDENRGIFIQSKAIANIYLPGKMLNIINKN